ncbi:MAG: DegV family protein [Chloroflexi bacterium]|nr:DegV family protein [Chloroflexota bacterium]
MTSKVRVVTDSTSCLPAELLSKYEIKTVPVGLVINNRVYRDAQDISLEETIALLQTLEKPPTTSAGNPGDFLNVFTELAQSTNDIICVLVSRQLSATQEAAYQAKRLIRLEHPQLNIEIVDSKTSGGALGFAAIEAARAAQEGKSLAEVVQVTKDMVSRVIYLAALDTLKYLIRMGRAPRGSTTFGEMLQVKPVVGFVSDSGLLDVVARVRGKERSLSKLAELVGKYADGGRPLHLMVHYADSTGEAEKLRDLITARYRCAEVYLAPYTPVMIGAAGPMIGIGFYS